MEELSVVRLPSLPPLAWLLDCSQDEPRLICGESIEVREADGGTRVFEGCWPGDFGEGDFLGSADFFGSGAACSADGEITFATSTHTLDAIYALFDGDRRLFSNSLAFLLRYAEADVGEMRALPKRIATVLNGLEAADVVLHERGPLRVERHVYCGLRLNGGGVERLPKPAAPAFSSFEDYHDHLRHVLGRTKANAADPRRRARYDLLTTCSSGYDSAACAALAAEQGCEEAITIRSARFGLDDSGAAVARGLGLRCAEYERPDRDASHDSPADAEFLASFCPGDCSFGVFDGRVRNRLLLTGNHGDKAWGMADADPVHFRRHGGSGMGFHEMRLRNDCVIVPVPFIGSYDEAPLTRISRSPEMDPYRVGGDYDRPIPRRLVEDAGGDRQSFGQRKAIASLAFTEWRLGAGTSEAADRYARHLAGRAFWASERLYRLAGNLLNAGIDLPPRRRAIRGISKRLMERNKMRFLWRPYRDYMTLWALEEVGKRYPTAGELAESRQPTAAAG